MPKNRRSKSERLLQATQNHNKWLKSMGVSDANPPCTSTEPYKLPRHNAVVVNSSESVGNGSKKPNSVYTGTQKHHVGLLYNKGNYGVISAEDAKDPATGKRRT